MSQEVIHGSPDEDGSVIEMIENGLYDIPYATGKGLPTPDTLHRELTPQEDFLQRMFQTQGPYDLLSEEQRTDLFRGLAESDRVYHQGEAEASDLPIGG